MLETPNRELKKYLRAVRNKKVQFDSMDFLAIIRELANLYSFCDGCDRVYHFNKKCNNKKYGKKQQG